MDKSNTSLFENTRIYLNQVRQMHPEQSIHWVLALSGGLDSRVLLDLLAQYRDDEPKAQADTFCAVHVHHGLSSNADQWVKSCRSYCNAVDIDFHYENVHLDLGPRVSLEQSARDARYQALKKYVRSHSFVLTAQHASDQLETFLLALKRGAGPKGLSAMPKEAKFGVGHLIRPLLEINQTELKTYAAQNRLDWIEDESNQDVRFDRNFLRHHVTPVLKNRFPAIEQTVSRSASLCAEQESLVQELLQDKLTQSIDEDNSLDLNVLLDSSLALRHALLRLWLEKQSFQLPTYAQLHQIFQDVIQAKQDASPVFSYHNVQIGRWKNRLYAFPKLNPIKDITVPLVLGAWNTLPDAIGEIYIHHASETQYDALQISDKYVTQKVWLSHTNDLSIQFHIAGGTRVKPQGRAHSRSLKKLWGEYQVPVWQRTRTPILMQEDRLVSILGLFVEHHYIQDVSRHQQPFYIIWKK